MRNKYLPVTNNWKTLLLNLIYLIIWKMQGYDSERKFNNKTKNSFLNNFDRNLWDYTLFTEKWWSIIWYFFYVWPKLEKTS